MPLNAVNSSDLLSQLLAGRILTRDDLDELLSSRPQEDLHLEFKDGLLCNRQQEASAKIQEQVSAFANSDGGVLVVGVAEPDEKGGLRRVSGCALQSDSRLDDWAGRVLQSMAPYFAPQPRIQVVETDAGRVLIVAVARSPSLVPRVVNSKITYSLRLHDSTVEAPQHLVADLVLGRRRHPVIAGRGVTCEPTLTEVEAGGRRYSCLRLYPQFQLENVGLVRCTVRSMGLVAWSLGRAPSPCPDTLRPYFTSFAPMVSAAAPPEIWQLAQLPIQLEPGRPMEIEPFLQLRSQPTVRLSVPSDVTGVPSLAALYLLPDGGLPIWFQVKLRPRFEDEMARTTRWVVLGEISAAAVDRPVVGYGIL